MMTTVTAESDDATLRQDKYEQAVQQIERLTRELTQAKQQIEQLTQQLRQHQVSAWLAAGNTYLSTQQYQKAVDVYTKAIAKQTDAVQAYRNRGIAYAKLGDAKRAFDDFDNAIHLGLEEAVVYNERGIAAYQLGNVEQARESFNRAIALDPELGQSYNNRAMTYRQIGNYEQAMQDLRQANQLGLTSASAYLQTLRDEVRQLQTHLQKAGFNPGPVDGIPGSQTRTALQAYQRRQGLPVTGRFDLATRQTLGLQPITSKPLQTPNAKAPPLFIAQPKPDYPELARQRGLQGTTILHIELLADGTVGNVKIAESSGHPILDTAAQEAVKQWRHKPATHNGAPITRWVQLGITFGLDDTTASEQ